MNFIKLKQTISAKLIFLEDFHIITIFRQSHLWFEVRQSTCQRLWMTSLVPFYVEIGELLTSETDPVSLCAAERRKKV